MDRRTLLAIVTFIGLYYAYVFVLRPVIYPEPPPEPAVAGASTNDATDGVQDSGDGAADATPAGADPADDTDSPASAEAPTDPIVPAAPAVPDRTLPYTSCTSSGTVTSRGGALGGIIMDDWEGPYEVQPIYMWLFNLVTGSGDTNWQPYGPPPGPQGISSEHARFLTVGTGDPSAPAPSYTLEQTPEGLIARGTTPDGIEVERTLRYSQGDPCMMNVEVTFTNPTGRRFDGPLWVGMHDLMPELATAYAHSPRPFWGVDGSSGSYAYPKEGGYWGMYKALDGPTRMDGEVDWFGMSDGYFAFVVLPEAGNQGRLVLSPLDVGTQMALEDPLDVPEDTVLYGHHYIIDGIDAGETVSQTFVAYTGPLESDVLSAIHPTLYYLVDLGWFAFFGRPLLWLLNLFHSFVGNWGLSIILLTVTVKLVFFPLTQMAYQSSQRMQLLQPELKKVREQFADNQEELNKRTMALFRENKVNPIGGCLPMLIQMPIWISLYRVLLTHVDLYHTKFLYLTDLSVQDPYAILPLVVVGLMFAQQQLMPTGNMDPNQARIMKFMPLIFGFLFFSFPSGLVLYIFVNMTLTILQQWFIKRRYKTASPAPAAAIAES